VEKLQENYFLVDIVELLDQPWSVVYLTYIFLYPLANLSYLSVLVKSLNQFVCLFVLVRLGFELRASHSLSSWSTTWATSPVHFALFCSGYFGDGVLQTIFLGWLRTSILLISASQIASLIVWATGVQQYQPVFWLASEEAITKIKCKICNGGEVYNYHWAYT
jgi:hypothetical protein